ncbi:MAG: signal recognition particle protein, partial [Corynebacterium durum]
PRMPMGGFPGMGGGMPGMPGGGMPDMAELQKLQQQMGGKLPKGMENIDFSQLGIEQDKKK